MLVRPMTKTAQELELMTDEGRFEELAAAVLRRARPEYRGLNDTGRNTQGRTIKSPVDGVYRIPGSSPSHYVIVQHTTVKLGELRGKWLNEKDGDVSKAVRWAEEQRRQEPGARVTLVLTCNRRVPDNLIADVGRVCSRGGLEEDIWSVFLLVAALLCRARATGVEMTDLQARELSERLGHDPLLISFWSEDSMREGPAPVSARVIERFIQKRMAELSKSDPASGLAEEYEGTLLSLSYRLLAERELRPTWSQAASWMGDLLGELPRLRRLVDQREVIRLESSAQGQRLVFRHDRVRDHLLARTFHRSMTVGEVPGALLADPYYAEVLGQALLLGNLDPTWASRIGHANPLALFYALRIFQRPATPMERAILEAMRQWVREEVVTDRCVMPLRESVDRILAETDSPHVLELTEDFPLPWPALWEARMRNGDVEAAAWYSDRLGIHFVSTRMGLLVQHAQETFGDRFVRDLSALLERIYFPEDLRIGALYLAGHLGDPKLAEAIARNWEEGCSTVNVLRAFLWAGLRCCSDPAPLLDPMLEFWGKLPEDRREKHRQPDRSSVATYGLSNGVARVEISDAAVLYLLIRASAQDGPLAWPLFIILRRLDHPDALEFCLRDKRGWDLTSYWDSRSFGRTAVMRSRDRLRRIWEEEVEDPTARERAFSLWSLGSNEEEIEVFRTIGPDSLLYGQALRKRADLGDRSCASEIVAKIETEEHPWTWWFHCERIWSEPIREALERHFEQRNCQMEKGWTWKALNEDWKTSKLLARISPVEAEEILIRHWAYLRYSPHFVQTALYLGSPRLLTLAAEAIRECPEPKKLFKFIHHREFAQDPELNRKAGLSLKRLESLAPYLHLLDEHAIDWLWYACNRQGFVSWRHEHVDRLVSEKSRKRLGVTDKNLIAGLDDFATNTRSRGFVDHWLDEFQKRGDPEGKAMKIVAAWLQEQRTFEALEVAAECVALGGTREDLALLETSGLPADDPRVASLLAATRFRVFRRSLS